MFDGAFSREFSHKIEPATKAESLNFSAHKRLYEDADLETLQGVLREIAFSLEELSDKNSRRGQEQKKLQTLAEDVMLKKEAKEQSGFVMQHRNKSKAELEKLCDKLAGQLPEFFCPSVPVHKTKYRVEPGRVQRIFSKIAIAFDGR